MKTKLQICLLVACILFPAHTFSSAVLVDAKGGVTVLLPGKAPQKAALGLELPDSSQVKAGPRGSASVMFEDGAVDQIAAGTSYTVGSQGQAAKRTELGSGIALAMRELAGGGEGPTIHGMVKEVPGSKGGKIPAGFSLGGIKAIYPLRTAIRLADNISFRWSQTPPVNWPRPAIVIDDETKTHLLVKSFPTGATQVEVGGAEAKLTKGKKYTWYLATEEGGLKGKSNRFEFSTLSEGDVDQIDADCAKINGLDMSQDGKDLLTAQIYYQHQLNDDLVKKLAPVWQRNKSRFIKKMLFIGYNRMGRPEAKSYQ